MWKVIKNKTLHKIFFEKYLETLKKRRVYNGAFVLENFHRIIT